MSSKEFNISITLILHWRVLRWGYHDDINYGYMSLFQLCVYMCNGQEYTFCVHPHICVYMIVNMLSITKLNQHCICEVTLMHVSTWTSPYLLCHSWLQYANMSSIQLCVYVCMAKSTHSACTLVYVYTCSISSFMVIVWEHFMNSVVYV